MWKWGCLLLFLPGLLFAEIRVPKPWNPGWFGSLGENPAVKYSGLRLGVLWTEPMSGVDCSAVGFFAEWGRASYRLAALYSHTDLDSIYRAERFGWEISLSPGSLNWGLSGEAEISLVPGEDADFRMVLRPGFSLELSRFRAGIWAKFPSDFEENAYAAEGFFSPGENFTGGVQIFYRRQSGAQISLGEELRLGVLSLQGAVSYPGPHVGVGVRVNIGRLGGAFGANRDGDYMDSKMFGLFWE